MKKLQNVLSVFVSGLYGLLVIAGFGFIGLLCYDTVKGSWGIIIFALCIFFGIFLGYLVYRTARRRGILEFITALNASPDLDNLEPGKDSNTRKLNAKEYIEKFNDGDKLCNGGYVRIWGDNRSGQSGIFNEIRMVNSDNQDILTIEFTNENKITVRNPKIIFEAVTYLKMTEAGGVKWEWFDRELNKRFYIDYRIENHSVKTETNSNLKNHKIDTILEQPAVFIFNTE